MKKRRSNKIEKTDLLTWANNHRIITIDVNPIKKTKEMKPSGKYPALYYQEADDTLGDRIRIIYPDGRAEWRVACDQWISFYADGSKIIPPCWGGEQATFEQQIKLMHEFDAKVGWGPAVYLGEIK